MNIKRFPLLMFFLLGLAFQAQGQAKSKMLTLTGVEAKYLYLSLNLVTLEPGTLIKNVNISAVREYDGPGPFTYFVTYSSRENRGQLYKIESQSTTGLSEAETLFQEFYSEGKGFNIHVNEPIDTQDIIDVTTTCFPIDIDLRAYECTVTQ